MPRSLPKRNNPLVLPGEAPAYEELVKRRGLGSTPIPLKASQAGTPNASKSETLGEFEYVHLRADLPKDLKGSEIFPLDYSRKRQPSYFLMRRSKDGFVSATGMFKIAFPWAKQDEEKSERKYLKSRESQTSEDEVAGNIWISPAFALELSKEYQMYDWVRALLDPAEISQKPSKDGNKLAKITPPPKFELPAEDTPQLSPSRTRTRRSASPSKRAGSPRKSKQSRGAKNADTLEVATSSESFQSPLGTTALLKDTPSFSETIATSVEADIDDKKPKATSRPKKTVSASTTEDEGRETKDAPEFDAEVKKEAEAEEPEDTNSTDLRLLPEAPSAEDTYKMIAQAKEMVQETIELKQEDADLSESPSVKATRKRKTDKLVDEDEESEASSQPTKRAKVLEEKLKRERVRNRALVGVTAVFALAASIPYFF